jgi:hypothetical protein
MADETVRRSKGLIWAVVVLVAGVLLLLSWIFRLPWGWHGH